MTRALLAFTAVLALAAPVLAQGAGIEPETLRVKPEHVSAKALFGVLQALCKRHGEGTRVTEGDGGTLTLSGLPEDVEALHAIVLLIDLPPIEPVTAHTWPENALWEGDAVKVVALHSDVEGELLQGWLKKLISYHPTQRSLQLFWIPDVRRLLIIGKPPEVDMASKAAEILMEAYHAGMEAGHE